MNEWLNEPGFWLVATMLIVTASQAVGALVAKKDYVAVAALARVVRESPEFDAADRKLVAQLLGNAIAWYAPISIFMIVPIFATYLAGRVVYLSVTRKAISEVNLLGSLLPKVSKLNKAASAATWKANPLLLMWVALWIVPPLLIVLILHGSSKALVASFSWLPLLRREAKSA